MTKLERSNCDHTQKLKFYKTKKKNCDNSKKSNCDRNKNKNQVRPGI